MANIETPYSFDVRYIKLLMDGKDGSWRAVAYMEDDYDRTWAVDMKLDGEPHILPGEKLRPGESN